MLANFAALRTVSMLTGLTGSALSAIIGRFIGDELRMGFECSAVHLLWQQRTSLLTSGSNQLQAQQEFKS